MNHRQGKPVSSQDLHASDHGAAVTIARAPVGSVSVCACGILTLTLQYISLRLEPGAFRELQGLLNVAQHQLNEGPAQAPIHEAGGVDRLPLH